MKRDPSHGFRTSFGFWIRRSRTKLIFCFAVCDLLLALCAPVEAQQSEKVPRIGYLSSSTRRSSLADDAFRQGLRDLGYIEGKTIVIEYRYADGKSDRLPKLAAELVEMKVDVIVTSGAPQSWKLASLSLLEIIFHLKDFQTRDGGDSAVVGQKRLAVTHQRSRHLDRIRWLEFERCSQMGRSLEEATINFNKSQTSAVGQQRLITIGKRRIAGQIWDDQNFHQTEAGCHSHEFAAIHGFKHGFTSGRKRFSSSMK
jgi:hypothetical protein